MKLLNHNSSTLTILKIEPNMADLISLNEKRPYVDLNKS